MEGDEGRWVSKIMKAWKLMYGKCEGRKEEGRKKRKNRGVELIFVPLGKYAKTH